MGKSAAPLCLTRHTGNNQIERRYGSAVYHGRAERFEDMGSRRVRNERRWTVLKQNLAFAVEGCRECNTVRRKSGATIWQDRS